MQHFKFVEYFLLGYFWLVGEEEGGGGDLLIIKATLASAEILAGAVAKADQQLQQR